MTVLPLQRDPASADFFDATANGQLLLRQCVPHAHWNPPAAMTCAKCGTTDLLWKEASGHGRIVSWAVAHGRPASPGQQAPRTPVAIVELDEGPWLRGQVKTTAAALVSGMAVTTSFERAAGGEAIPVFEPHPDGPSRPASTDVAGGTR